MKVEKYSENIGQKTETSESGNIEPFQSDIESEVVNSHLKTKNMDVHHHAHQDHGKRTWKSYFWEFLMLFLAVSLGAYVENLRERNVHQEEVEKHIRALLDDLEADTALFDLVADRNNYSAAMADSLIELLHTNLSNTADIYYTAGTVTANNGYGYTNAKSYDQLKSSGLLRYIQSRQLLDSIGAYYTSFQWLNNQTELKRLTLNEIQRGNAILFNSHVFQQMTQVPLKSIESGRTYIKKPEGTPALLSDELHHVNAVSNNYHYYSLTTKLYRHTLLDLKERAVKLIEMIRKEYPMD